MGYTHYWYREPRIDAVSFQKIADDFAKLVPVMATHGVSLAGGLGQGDPTISKREIWFNGPEACGHQKNDSVIIPWPAPGATGLDGSANSVAGGWFAGALLDARCCNGDCSYETFSLPRIYKPEEWERKQDDGRYFACCKTAFRPYDIAVTAALLIAKHHLGGKILVRSDGEDSGWFDAQMLCQSELGYGMEYSVASGDLAVKTTESEVA